MPHKLDNNVILVGDTHLGRKFKSGVPQHKRGEIEESYYKEFEKTLSLPCETYVQLGDLFDSPVVPFDLIHRVYNTIKNVSQSHPNTNFYFIAGNHDLHRDSAKISAIQILRLLLNDTSNVHFVIDSPMQVGHLQLQPWSYDPDNKIEILSENVTELLGHFEGPEVFDLPVKVYSGHLHKGHRNKNVTFIGSNTPIAFGEQSDDSFCIEVFDVNELEGMDLRNKRVRVHLKEGEVLPTDIDCLQLISKPYGDEEKESVELTVDLEDYNFEELFFECLHASGKAELMWAKYLNLKNRG